jgi:hypothetical protein
MYWSLLGISQNQHTDNQRQKYKIRAKLHLIKTHCRHFYKMLLWSNYISLLANSGLRRHILGKIQYDDNLQHVIIYNMPCLKEEVFCLMSLHVKTRKNYGLFTDVVCLSIFLTHLFFGITKP